MYGKIPRGRFDLKCEIEWVKFGRINGDMLLGRLTREEDKAEIIRRKKALGSKKIYIDLELSKTEREEQMELINWCQN